MLTTLTIIFSYLVTLIILFRIIATKNNFVSSFKKPDLSKFPSYQSTQVAESTIQNDSSSLNTRIDLIQAYFFQYSDNPQSIPLVKTHIEWIIQHHPDKYFLYVEGKSFYAGNSQEEHRISNLWKNTLYLHAEKDLIFKNMGHFLTNIDNLTAYLCLKKYSEMHPLSPEAKEDFMFFCNLFNIKPLLSSFNEQKYMKWSETDYQAWLLLRSKCPIIIPSFLGIILLYVNFLISRCFAFFKLNPE